MKKILAGLGVSLLPVVALAQDFSDVEEGATGALESLTNIVNAVIPFFLAIAVVVFIYGVIKYVVSSAPDDKAAGRSYIIYGIIGIAVILSIFGLVKLLQNTFNITDNTLDEGSIPQI